MLVVKLGRPPPSGLSRNAIAYLKLLFAIPLSNFWKQKFLLQFHTTSKFDA